VKTDLRSLLFVIAGAFVWNGAAAAPPATTVTPPVTAAVPPATTVLVLPTGAVVVQPPTANTPIGGNFLLPVGGTMAPVAVGGQLSGGAVPGGQLLPGVVPGGQLSPGAVSGGQLLAGAVPGGMVTVPPAGTAFFGTPAGTLNYGFSNALIMPPTSVIVTGGVPATVPGGAISGTGVGGTSRVIVTGGTANSSFVAQPSSSVIVTGGTLTPGGVGGTNVPAKSH